MVEIIYNKRAKIELENAYNYIFFNLANPIAANNFRVKILKQISYLKYFPDMGKKVSNSNIRFICFKNYLILYSVNNQIVEIQRILNKRQNFKNIIKKMKF